jgi:hypothetical protein
LTDLHLSSKLFNFDSRVLQQTRNDILNRNTNASTAPGNLNGLAAGMSNHEIEKANRYIVAEEAEFGFAKKIMKLGGRKNVSMIAGLATGIVALAGYLAFGPKGKEEEGTTIIKVHSGHKIAREDDTSEQHSSEHEPRQHHKKWQENIAKEHADKDISASRGVSA